ncbi:MBL fold metallo-hydrolase [Geosporobacter ferrireducens]|uniref:MBL fold metallo-hydrolase n=1 Tax=Geosporobacter ferrireducens TaxID=1424294 RepID=A0A1D8GCI1_9FIRM|nr:MBL fold metallo-hydrolase [Geosporobacter ferrireducens]AOT68608.1 MBL fold metallo-hydrolase [Geosporobacter ferrireducens]MTI54079.1 MBL fold metallo-hydrolase [Geosporobacter ferrireducens]
MKLTILLDNNTFIDRYFYGEPGVAYLIESEGKKILFDTGYSDAFIRNAQKMGVSLLDLDYIVLSHGHMDHTWGLIPLMRHYIEAAIEGKAYMRPTVVAHPFVCLTRSIAEQEEIGSLLSQEKLGQHFHLALSKVPVWLTEKLVFLGEIERGNDFEAQKPIGKILKDGSLEEDYLLDDSALVYRSAQGLVIITGCSHAGICNIIEYAKQICEDERIVDIVGGLHLLDPDEKQIQGTLEYIKKQKLKNLHACHCTDLHSKIALSQITNLKEVGVGLVLEYE